MSLKGQKYNGLKNIETLNRITKHYILTYTNSLIHAIKFT